MLNKFFIRKLFCNSGVSGINLNINLNIIHNELYTICLELYKFFIEKFKRQLFLSTSCSKLLIWVSHRLVFSGFTGASLSCRDYCSFLLHWATKWTGTKQTVNRSLAKKQQLPNTCNIFLRPFQELWEYLGSTVYLYPTRIHFLHLETLRPFPSSTIYFVKVQR